MQFVIVLVSIPSMSQEQAPTTSQVVVSVAPGVAAEHLVQKVEPEYPPKAIDAQIQGDVLLDATIGKNGEVKDVRVVTGNPALAHSAVDAVRHWRYTPFTDQGQPIETRTQITVSFVLTKSGITCPGHQGDLYSFLTDSKAGAPITPGGTAGASPEEHRVFKVSNGVKAPHPIYAPDPEDSQSARLRRRQGKGVLQIIVTPEGRVARVKIDRVIGFGVDQKAINAVCEWRFNPALKDGRPVAVQTSVEVTFRLY